MNLYLSIPCAEGFDGTAEHDDLSGKVSLWRWSREAAGSSPPLLHIVQAHVEADGLRQQWQQSPLLQLIVYDGRVTSTPATSQKAVFDADFTATCSSIASSTSSSVSFVGNLSRFHSKFSEDRC